jgi:hypothetical protein
MTPAGGGIKKLIFLAFPVEYVYEKQPKPLRVRKPMTTDTLSPVKTSRVEYTLAEVYKTAEARLNKLNAKVAALTVPVEQNYAAGMLVSQQKTAQEIFNTLTEWKKAGVTKLVTDTPVCGESPVEYRVGCSLAEQIKSKRLAP